MRDEQTRASVFLPPSWLDEEGRLCYSAHVLESIPEESEPPSSRTSRYGSFHRDTEAPRRPGRGDSLFSPETGEGDVSLFADSDSHESAASPLEEGRGDGPAPGAPLHLESKRADAGVLPPGEVFSPDVACARHVDGDRGKRAGDGPQRQEQLDHKGPDAGAGEGYGLVFRESGRAPSLEGAAPLHTEPSEDPRKQRETGSFAEGEAGSEVGDTRELSICSPPEQPEVPPPRQASSGQDAPCCGEKASCFVRQNSPLQSYGEAPNGEVSFPHTSHGSLHVPAPHDASNAARVRASSVQEQSALSRPFTQAEPRRPLSAPPPRPSSLDSRGAALVSPEREERTFSPESTGSPLCAAARYADARTDKPRAVRMPSALGDDERDGTGKPGAKREKEKWRAEEIAEEAPFENAIDEKRNGRHRVGLSGSSSGNHGTLPSSALPFPLWAALRFGSLSFFLDFRDVIALSAASFPLRLLLCGSQPCASPHALLAFGEGEGGDTAEEKKGRVFQSLFSSDAPGARDASPQVARQGADTRESEKGRRTPAPGQRRHGQAERRRGKERGALRKDTLEVEEEMKSEWSRFNALAQRRKTDTSGEKTERRARECAALPAGVFSHIRVTTAWAALDEEFVRELFRRATRLSVLEISIRRDCLSALLQRGSPVPARTSPFVPAASSGCSHSPCCRQSCSGPSAAVQRRLMLCLERAVSAFVLNCETLESFALHVEGEDAGSPFFFSPTSRVNWASPTPSPRSRFHPASASPSSVSSSFSRFGCSSLGFEPRLGELWEAPTAQSVDHLFPRLRRFSSRGTFGLLILLSSCLHAWIQSEGFSSRPTPGQELRGAGEQQRGTEGRKGRDREGGGDARVSFSGLFRSWAFAKDRKRCREKGVGVQQRTADRAPAAEANEHFKRSAPTLTHLEISDRSSWFDLSLLLPFLSSLAQPACEGDERRPLSAAASASVSSLASAETGERREARLAGLELALAFLREQTAKFLHFLGSLIRASHASLHALTLDFAPPLLFQRLRSCSPSAEPASSPPASPAQSRKTHAQGDTAAVGNVFPSFENCGPLSGLLLLSDRLFSSLVRSDLPPLFGSDQARVLSSGQGRSRKDEKGRETDLVQPRGEREETEGQKGQTPRRHSNDREFHGSEEPFPDGSECEERERDASYFGAYLFLLSLILPSFSAVSPPSTSFSFPYLVCLSLSDAIATGKALRRSSSRQHDLGQGEHTVCAERRGEKRGCGASPGSSTAAQSGRSGGLAKHAQSSHFAFMRLRSLQIVDFNPLLHLLLSEAAFAWRNEISHVPSRSPSSPSPHTQPPAPSSLALSLVWEGEGVEEWKGEEEEENETGESDREDDSCVWSSASSSRASASRARGRLPTARQGEKEGEAKNWEYTEGLQEYLDVCDTLRRHRRFGAELIHAFLSKLPRFSLVLPPSGVQAARTLALLFSPSTSSLFSSEVARRRAMGLVLPFFMNPALFPLAEKPGNPCLSASSLRAVEGARDFPAFASSPREPPHEACAVSTVSAVSCALSASRPLPDPAPRLGRKSEEGLSFSVSPPELDRFVGILKLLTATALLEHGFLFPLESPDFFLERERRVRLRGTRDEKDGGKAPREKRRGLWDFLSALSTFPSSSSMPATRGLRKDERASTRDAPCPRTPARSLSSPQPRRQRRSVLWSALWPRDLEEPTPSARKRERRASARHRLGSASPCGDETAGKEGAETREAREETDSQDDSSSWTEREDASPSNCDAPISRWPGAPSLLSSGEHPSCASRSYERGERRKVSGFSEPEQRQSARLPSRLRSNVSTHAVHTASSSATWARRFVVPFCFSSSSSSPFSGGVYGEARNARRGVRTGDRRRLARGLSRDVECMRQFKKQEIGLKPTEASLRFLHQQLNGLGWEGPRRLPDPAAGETRGTQGEKSGDKSGLGQREKGAALGPQSVAGPPVRRKTLLEQRLEKAELLLWREQGEERAKGEDGRTGEGRKGEGITGEGREEEGRSRGKKGCERRTVQSYSVSSDGRIPVFAKGRTNLPRHFRYVDRVVSSLSGVFSDVRRSASSFFRQSEAGEGDQERGQNPTEEREASEIHDGEPRPDAGRFVSKWKSFFVFSGRKDGEERTLRTRETVRPKPGKVPVKKRGRLLNHVHPYSCIETLELLFIPPASRSTAMPSSSGSCLSCSLSSLSCFSCVSCSCCSSSRSSLASDREATRALCRRLFASHSPYRTALIQIFRFTLPRLRLFRLAFASHRPHPSSVPVFLPQKVRAGDPTFSNRSRLFVSCSSSRSPPCLCGEEESRRLMRAERDRTDESRFRSLFRALGFDDETGGKSRDEACLELPATLREFEPVSPCLRDAPDGAFGSACLFLLDVRPGGRDGRISPRAPAPLLFSVTSLACFARMSSSALCRAASLEEAPPSPSSVPESASTLPTSSPRLLSASSESSWSSPRSAHSSPRLLRLSSSASFHRLGRLPASVSLAYLAVAPDLISSAIARSSLLPRLLFPLLRRASSLFAACQQIERNYAHFLPAPVQLPEAPTRMAGEVRTAVLAAVDVVLEEIELLPPREEEARRRGEAASEEGDRSGETHRAKTVERTGR
ncbi:putative ATPase, AAA family domain-containing protein [Neospora caninum Liverpool]|uniref:Putative ATPase, AAA family domain-containing protein n=1 Tax=Neospora caninum (strain Liverpool) TaxID=572307 RepID=F0VKC8_NEOCL|nr:putative ATPase, AAA family domain-containing protein [Neospora caninum Liverpool]CBZ54529.1 putative ATPase, AAA family domain-containing protein [Neospora caninum Liverpool]|eukprot:XP_003884559.1 putative ATPase, AAA family domain-containing protein [Neospora caninum Liverpool]